MQVVCSFCHMRFDQALEEGAEQAEGKVSHLVCPSCICPRCKSEIGIERVVPPPKPMQLFGAILATSAFLVVVISGLVAMAS